MLCLSTRSIHQSYKDSKRFSTTRLPALACGWMSKELCLQRPSPPPPPYKLYCIPFLRASFWCPAQNQFNEMNLKKKNKRKTPEQTAHGVLGRGHLWHERMLGRIKGAGYRREAPAPPGASDFQKESGEPLPVSWPATSALFFPEFGSLLSKLSLPALVGGASRQAAS